MSRISDALRHADRTGAIPPPPPPPAWAPRRAAAVRFNRVAPSPVAMMIPRQESALAVEETPKATEMPEKAPTLELVRPAESLPGFWLTFRRLISSRFGENRVGRALIKMGVLPRNTYQVPKCSAVTRNGVPCRAPSMANGRCRMHGGSKQRGIWEFGK